MLSERAYVGSQWTHLIFAMGNIMHQAARQCFYAVNSQNMNMETSCFYESFIKLIDGGNVPCNLDHIPEVPYMRTLIGEQ